MSFLDLRETWAVMPPRRQLLSLLAIVVIAAVVPYLNSLQNEFAFDDAFIVMRNVRVHDWTDWRAIWLTPYWPVQGPELGLYRPLTIFLFAIQWAVQGGSPFIYHLVNVLMHALVSVLLFLLLSRWVDRMPALLGAIVFAVHPVHTEAIANVVGQAELTAAAAALAACLVYATREPGVSVSWRRRAAVALLYAIALLAKESAVMLPGLLVLMDFMQRRVTLTASGLRSWIGAQAMPIFLCTAVLVAYLTLRFDALGGALMGTDAGPAFPYLKEHRLLNAFRAFPEYLRLLFWPADLTIDYAPATVFAVESLTVMSAIGALVLGGLVALAATTPWRPRVGAPAAWFLIGLSPVSNLFFPIGVLIAERTLYLPSAALSILVAVVAAHAPALDLRRRRVLAAAFAAAIVALGVRTHLRNPAWKTSAIVQQTLLREHPESYHAQWGQALALWGAGYVSDAENWWKLAFRTYQTDSNMLASYGGFLMATGRDRDALWRLEEAHRRHPYLPNVKALLAYLYITTRQYPRALEAVSQGEDIAFPATISQPLKAYAYQGMGMMEVAASTWGQMAQRTPQGRWLAHGYHARTLAFLGRDEEALAAIDKGLRVLPDQPSAKVLLELRRAIRNGCYRQLDPRLLDDLYGPPASATCDPLGSWFDRLATVQGASLSQFAIPKRLTRVMELPPVPPK